MIKNMRYSNRSMLQADTARRSQIFRTVFSGMIVVLVATVVTGCRALDPPPPSHVFTDPSIRFPISVVSEPVSIDIPVGRTKDGIVDSTRRKILQFLREYRRTGAGQLFLAAPSARRRSPVVSATIDELWNILDDHGISGGNVRVHQAGNSSITNPWISLTYYRDAASAPPCEIWEHNVAETRDNTPMDNLGCSQRANLAAMVAYPSDLVRQRSIGERDNYRRADVHEKYAKGTLGEKKNKKKGGSSQTKGK